MLAMKSVQALSLKTHRLGNPVLWQPPAQRRTPHETQPAPSTPPQDPARPEDPSPPAPKKLRFSSAADTTIPRAQQAMTPSHLEQGEEETSDEDPTVNVDFF